MHDISTIERIVLMQFSSKGISYDSLYDDGRDDAILGFINRRGRVCCGLQASNQIVPAYSTLKTGPRNMSTRYPSVSSSCRSTLQKRFRVEGGLVGVERGGLTTPNGCLLFYS